MTDAEMIQIARDFRDGMIGKNTHGGGQCAKVSWGLAGYLKSICGVDCECVTSDHRAMNTDWIDHVWIMLADGRALDPTFDQFCREEPVAVYLGKPTKFHTTPPQERQNE